MQGPNPSDRGNLLAKALAVILERGFCVDDEKETPVVAVSPGGDAGTTGAKQAVQRRPTRGRE